MGISQLLSVFAILQPQKFNRVRSFDRSCLFVLHYYQLSTTDVLGELFFASNTIQ